jgi:hypothetical protein
LAKSLGLRTYRRNVDDDGNRTYTATYLVQLDMYAGETMADAPDAEDLPQPGDSFEVDGDAIRTQKEAAKIHKEQEGDPFEYVAVEMEFTTKANSSSCAEAKIDNPLMQPPKLSGNFVKVTEEARFDRFGHPILNPAGELMRGPQVEFDENHPEIHIKQNVADLELDMLSRMSDTLNMDWLWGFPPRTIRFTPGPWEENWYGGCLCYYTRELIFEIICKQYAGVFSHQTGTGTGIAPEYVGDTKTWDRVLLGEGTKVLRGRWDKDPSSQYYKCWRVDKSIVRGGRRSASDFIRFKDWNGENARVVLDCYGTPAHTRIVYDGDVGTGTALSTGTDDLGAGEFPGEDVEPPARIRGQHIVTTDAGFVNYYVNPWDSLGPLGTDLDFGFDDLQAPGVPRPVDGGNRPCQILVEKMGESDFLLLGIPVDLFQCRRG